MTDATVVLISSRRRIKFRIFFAEKFFYAYPHTASLVVRGLNFVEASAFFHIFQNTDYEFWSSGYLVRGDWSGVEQRLVETEFHFFFLCADVSLWKDKEL